MDLGDRVGAVMGYIGANVHQFRVRRRMTQDELAKAAGVSRAFLHRVERGKSSIGLASIVALADALGVPPWKLLRPAIMPEAKRGRPRGAPARRT
ncbi:helix-turn-helix domain-containing protein [Sorangium sp. So ce233]|uniref:helix-turn-helix domain-containing protein n=1 Tax=Sorangium sp. So ce233 TaxID=3133290 RepID=UPI003F630C40